MQLDKIPRVNGESYIQSMATMLVRARAIRQGNRRNNRLERKHRKIMDNKISSAEKQGNKRPIWFGSERYNAYVFKEANNWLVYFRHAPCELQTGKEYMERYRKHQKRLPVGRQVHMGREMDRTAESNSIHK